MRGLIEKVNYNAVKLIFILYDELASLSPNNFIELSKNERVLVVALKEYEIIKRDNGSARIKIDSFGNIVAFAKCEVVIAVNEQTSDVYVIKHRKFNPSHTSGMNDFKNKIKDIINEYKYEISVSKYMGLNMEESMCEKVANVLESELETQELAEIEEAKKFLNRYK